MISMYFIGLLLSREDPRRGRAVPFVRRRGPGGSASAGQSERWPGFRHEGSDGCTTKPTLNRLGARRLFGDGDCRPAGDGSPYRHLEQLVEEAEHLAVPLIAPLR